MPLACLATRSTIAFIGVVALGALLAPSAVAACSPPVVDGLNSYIVCRPAGHEQTFVVPAGVRRVNVVAAGAPGGSGTAGSNISLPAAGGAGGLAVADIRVTPGRTLYVLVGAIGLTSPAGGGGFNGGGRGGPSSGRQFSSSGAGGGGGGASDVRTCSTRDPSCDMLASRLIVAAGGGGAGGGGAFGGASAGAGGSAGADGTAGAGFGLGAGQGATAAGGGNGGPGAGAGVLGLGGAGAHGPGTGDHGGGGGGGGSFGGGGGAVRSANEAGGSGGGAGASFGPPGTKLGRSLIAQGLVRITYATPSSASALPAVTIVRPRHSRSVSGRAALVIAGRARDASGVRGVALRIERLPRATGRCTWLDPAAGLRRGRCDAPPSLFATLRPRGAWSYSVAASIALPRGRYRATAYGTDETGIYGNAAPASRSSVVFHVRSSPRQSRAGRARDAIAPMPATGAARHPTAVPRATQAEARCSTPVFQDPNTVVNCPTIGAEQAFVVPAGVRKVRVIAIGAGGGDGSDSNVCEGGILGGPPCSSAGVGGSGGVGTIASADLRVTPGRTLYVLTGGRGATLVGPAGGAGGFNGGAAGGTLLQGRGFSNYHSGGGGGGGGASDVRTCSILDRSCDSLASRLLVAAGGGGGGGDRSFGAGFGGVGGVGGGVGSEISDGSPPDGGAGGVGGLGATLTAGGGGGPGAAPGTAGTGGAGAGARENIENGGGGGGGGGFFGGGGGSTGGGDPVTLTPGAGGGGGSSFGPRRTRFAHAARLDAGSVRIVYLVRRVTTRPGPF